MAEPRTSHDTHTPSVEALAAWLVPRVGVPVFTADAVVASILVADSPIELDTDGSTAEELGLVEPDGSVIVVPVVRPARGRKVSA